MNAWFCIRRSVFASLQLFLPSCSRNSPPMRVCVFVWFHLRRLGWQVRKFNKVIFHAVLNFIACGIMNKSLATMKTIWYTDYAKHNLNIITHNESMCIFIILIKIRMLSFCIYFIVCCLKLCLATVELCVFGA